MGCGISAQAELFAGFRYVGADLNRPRLGRGRRDHPWARYAVQDITGMGWTDAAFDAILCLEVIEHLPIPARPALVRELFRVLRPGGALVLSTPSGQVTPWKRVLGRKCERSHEPELARAEVSALVAQAGGAIRLIETVDNLILPAGRVSAGLAHLIADKERVRRGIQRLARAAGYETLLYLITGPRPARAPTAAAMPG
jgi:SAM-dependent methyltransferase